VKLEKRLHKREMFNMPVGFAISYTERKGIKDIHREATGVDISGEMV
jgi:hypothetical protein